jgi:hypothetical protein
VTRQSFRNTTNRICADADRVVATLGTAPPLGLSRSPQVASHFQREAAEVDRAVARAKSVRAPKRIATARATLWRDAAALNATLRAESAAFQTGSAGDIRRVVLLIPCAPR